MTFGYHSAATYFQAIVAVGFLCAPVIGAEGPGRPLVATQLTYQVHYQSKGYTDLSAAIGKAPSTGGGDRAAKHDLLGTFEAEEIITILDNSNTGGFRASVKFVKPTVGVQVDGRSQVDGEREVVAELGKTIYFYLDANGRVERTEFPTQYSSMARNFVRAILLTQQFVLPASHHIRPTWLTRETGAGGPYSALYQTKASSGTVARVSKTISSLRRDSAAPAGTTETGIAARTVPRGDIQFSITKQGTVERVQGTFHEDIFLQDRPMAAQDTYLLAQLSSSRSLPQGELVAARRAFIVEGATLSTSVSAEDPGRSEREMAVQRQILAQDSAESIQQALSLLDRQSGSREQQTRIYLKLKALLYLRPDDTAAFGKALSTLDLEKSSAEMIATALAAVGSAEAQRALCNAIQSRRSEARAVTTLVPLFGSVHQPTKQVVSLLEELARSSAIEIQSVALLGLGAVAKNLARQSPDSANSIVLELVNRLFSSTGDQKATVLLALGNTGSNRARSIIISQKTDRSAGLRRAVTTALSGFQSTESDATLCEMLKTDDDSQVRAAAAQALSARNKIVSVKKTLLNAAQQDKADNVRIASLFAMTNSIPQDQSVRQVVERVSHNDASEVVRQQATKLLEMNSDDSGSKRLDK